MLKYSERYNDIINLPHHLSKTHPRMSIEARSAQFAPFSALNGYDELIKETARETKHRIEIAEEQKTILNEKLYLIKEQIHTNPNITVTYFVPDVKKNGGKYVTVTGKIIKIDDYNQKIILDNKNEIPILEIIDVLL